MSFMPSKVCFKLLLATNNFRRKRRRYTFTSQKEKQKTKKIIIYIYNNVRGQCNVKIKYDPKYYHIAGLEARSREALEKVRQQELEQLGKKNLKNKNEVTTYNYSLFLLDKQQAAAYANKVRLLNKLKTEKQRKSEQVKDQSDVQRSKSQNPIRFANVFDVFFSFPDFVLSTYTYACKKKKKKIKIYIFWKRANKHIKTKASKQKEKESVGLWMASMDKQINEIRKATHKAKTVHNKKRKLHDTTAEIIRDKQQSTHLSAKKGQVMQSKTKTKHPATEHKTDQSKIKVTEEEMIKRQQSYQAALLGCETTMAMDNTNQDLASNSNKNKAIPIPAWSTRTINESSTQVKDVTLEHTIDDNKIVDRSLTDNNGDPDPKLLQEIYHRVVVNKLKLPSEANVPIINSQSQNNETDNCHNSATTRVQETEASDHEKRDATKTETEMKSKTSMLQRAGLIKKKKAKQLPNL
ncbi:hypothetical protein RFI_01233 [Reticulomyxa filosa]|uniref:Uncharacterized protein n=1 Tax=Reticulomyxa filosa TaxID=46433 RepID=X6PCK1_RETFI|nr:hypothetical protein RFI_01233 [Reticulomyxa filosa]|eukprot:ETO35833.1 hypothetical protein RFI_01233 [Reticulomyxa filosa]